MERLWNANYVRAWSANFMLNFSFMILTPLLPLYLSEQFHANKDQIGLVLSGYTLTALLVRPFSGYIVDSFPRKMVLLVCYALFAVLFGGYLVAGSLLLFAVVRTLHGAPMGATTVSNSTVAIDVLPSVRRAEGIGYYGLSNNVSTAIAPAVGLAIYHSTGNFNYIFILALVVALMGWGICASLRLPQREVVRNKEPLSFDRFLLVKGLPEGCNMLCFAFAFGVVSTYLAIYGKEMLGITAGSGFFFLLLSTGLVVSRLVGVRSLRQGKLVENASYGICISAVGYLLFAALHNAVGFYAAALIIGLGNGYMFPSFQTMFVNLAEHNQRGTANSTMFIAWDLGIGMGIIVGGVVVEHCGYSAAFWIAWVVSLVGILLFFLRTRRHFLAHRLR